MRARRRNHRPIGLNLRLAHQSHTVPVPSVGVRGVNIRSLFQCGRGFIHLPLVHHDGTQVIVVTRGMSGVQIRRLLELRCGIRRLPISAYRLPRLLCRVASLGLVCQNLLVIIQRFGLVFLARVRIGFDAGRPSPTCQPIGLRQSEYSCLWREAEPFRRSRPLQYSASAYRARVPGRTRLLQIRALLLFLHLLLILGIGRRFLLGFLTPAPCQSRLQWGRQSPRAS